MQIYPLTLDTINSLTKFLDELFPIAAETGVYLDPISFSDFDGNPVGTIEFDDDDHAYFVPAEENDEAVYGLTEKGEKVVGYMRDGFTFEDAAILAG